MAQPTDYDRQYSFTQLAAENPSAPYTGAQLDSEFNAIKATLDETLANIALIQSDEGDLKNQTVGPDQLAASLTIGVNPPTMWATATAYSLYAAVFYGTTLYRCEEAHTSGTFSTDLGAGKWAELADFNTLTLEDNAVTTAKIADLNVTTAKIASDAVTRAKIADAAMSGDDATLITGTAGTDGDLAVWNADGDLVDGPTPPSGDIVGTTDAQTLASKVLTLPQINDTSADHQYVFGVSELAADRTVTLPLLTGNDTFVFEGHAQTLTGKTLGATTLSGKLSAADQEIERPKFTDYGETVNNIGDFSGGSQAINMELGNVVLATVSTATVTFTFTNPPATGIAGSFTLILTNGGSQTVNWPAAVDWAGGTAPSLTTSGVDVLTFVTVDAGMTWYGFPSGLDMS